MFKRRNNPKSHIKKNLSTPKHVMSTVVDNPKVEQPKEVANIETEKQKPVISAVTFVGNKAMQDEDVNTMFVQPYMMSQVTNLSNSIMMDFQKSIYLDENCNNDDKMKFSSQLLFLIPLAMGIGIAMTFQTAINSQLREYLYSPLQAALFSFLVGTIVLAFLVFFQPATKPELATFGQIPWYLWIGGCLGVYAISVSIYTAPKLGFLTLSGLIIFGQIIMSMIVDQFGLLGTEKTPINWQRLLGGVVIFIGVLLTLQR